MHFPETRPEPMPAALSVCGDDQGDVRNPASAGSPKRLNRRSFVVAGVAAGATAPLLLRGGLAGASPAAPGTPGAAAAPRAFGYPPPDLDSRIVNDITFPVEGEVSWRDTFGVCRAGCSRYHEGQDLIGDKLQKLIACVDGEVVELRHRSSGNSLYIRGDDGYYYVYLHINNDSPGTDDAANPYQWAFAPGVTEGGRVRRGQHVAYMGDSGNAEHITHLHFEMRKPAGVVWDSAAVNAAPSLENASPPPPQVPPETFEPFADADDFVIRQFVDFYGRFPDDNELTFLTTPLNRGHQDPRWVPASVLLPDDQCQRRAGAVVRLYQAFFRRPPDTGGYRYWTERVNRTGSLGAAANSFARSAEFQGTYGSLDDEEFVDLVYENVLRRTPDKGGRTYWVDRIRNTNLSRGRMMLNFSESPEFRSRERLDTDVHLMYGCMLRRIPSEGDHYYWRAHIAAGYTNLQNMAKMFIDSPEYQGRFA